MTKSLETGYVPVARIVEAISEVQGIEGVWHDYEPSLQPLTVYWPMCDVRKMLGMGVRKVEWIPFDFADKILCILNMPSLWWGPLADIYQEVNLSVPLKGTQHRKAPIGFARCENSGCSNEFRERGVGTKKKRYCSQTCRLKALGASRRIGVATC